jgi:hypothetical protein
LKPARGAWVVTSDCYAILGVTPAAEDVVIGAAYRALMRHYHPDTNPDPAAQARAQEISAAYAVLRDPARRAEYDAQRSAGGILWDIDERAEPPPPMRAGGIATAMLAVLLVGAVWAWPRQEVPPDGLHGELAPASKPAAPKAADGRPAAPRDRLGDTSASAPPVRPPVPAPAPETPALVASTVVAPPKPVQVARAEPARATPRAAAPASPPPAEAKVAEPKPAGDQRVASLDRMSSGFFSQSMVHATDAKKALLLAARDRSAAQRKGCRSDTCVADAYLRYIRETSAIMEGRPGPK